LDPQCLDPCICNLIGLHNLSENAVLHMLRNRFKNDLIYTFVSSILIAVNPFRALNIYDNDTMDLYRKSKDQSRLPPHIFTTAGNAYETMIRKFASQSIVISGESGAV
jgi:myosin heavy subunit